MIGINEKVVGKCGICGGAVVTPVMFHGVNRPIPTCKSCGATHRPQDTLPTLPMRPAGPDVTPRRLRLSSWF